MAFTPPKIDACPLKRGHFKGNLIFQPLFSKGDILVFGGVVAVTLKNVLVNRGIICRTAVRNPPVQA